MLASGIVEIIERRRARFQAKLRPSAAADLSTADLVNLRIAEEYDALMAEVEALLRAASHSHPQAPIVREYPEDRSEEWILGEQGQLGG